MNRIPDWLNDVISHYGMKGGHSASLMQESLQRKGIEIYYKKGKREFIIKNSSHLPQTFLQNLFDAEEYKKWKPFILDRCDKNGNKRVKLGYHYDRPWFSSSSREFTIFNHNLNLG